MLNLLKSDLYRLVHGKMLWVMTACVLGIAALTVFAVAMVSSPEFLYASSQSFEMAIDYVEDEGLGDSSGGEGSAGYPVENVVDTAGEESAEGSASVSAGEVEARFDDDDTGVAVAQTLEATGKSAADLTVADFEDASRDMRTFASPTDMLGDAMLSGGFASLLTCLLVALLFASDFATGFARNLVMDRRGRLCYYGEKLLLTGMAALYFVLLAAAACTAFFAAAGFAYAASNSVGEVAGYLGLGWLIAWAYGCLTAVVVWMTRSGGAGIAFAIVVGTGMLGAMLGQVLLILAGGIAPWAGAVEPWLLASCQGALGLGMPDLMEGALVGPGSSILPAVRVVVASVFWIAASAAISFAWLRKRDV